MTRSAHHVRLTPGYILHHQPYRDTSRILEVESREFGRLSVFARGVRGSIISLERHNERLPAKIWLPVTESAEEPG